MNLIKRICCIIFCLLILSCITFSAGAAENQKIVKVGSPEVDKFLTFDKSGNESGFLADYLKAVSAKTGWNFEFVKSDSFQYREMLKNGTIDMYAPVTKDNESEKDYCFSSEKCCISYITLVTYKENDRLYYEDWANYGELSIGMMKNGTLNNAFEQYAKKQGLKYKKVYFDDASQMRNAVINRQTDCAVLSNLDINTDVKTIARINFKPAFFIADKEKRSLIDEFSSAVYSILLENPSFIANLFSQYYGKAEKSSQCFTRQEAAFVQQSSPIKVVVDINNTPFQSYDSISHKFEGINVSVIDMIEKISGLKFEYVYTENAAQSWQCIKTGKADVIAGVYADDSFSDYYCATATSAYFNESYISITKKDKSFYSTDALNVAVSATDVGLAEYITKFHPEWNIIYSENVNTCLNSVSLSRADVTFVSSMQLQKSMIVTKYSSLTTAININLSVPLSMTVSQKSDTLLMSVLNKSLNMMDENLLQQLVTDNTKLGESAYSINNLISYNPALFLTIVIIINAVIVAICVLLYKNHYKTKQTLAVEEKNKQLETANSAKTDFLSRMSHDIRTPMNAIIGLTNIAAKENTDKDVAKYLADIDSSSHFLLGIINDILDISQFESGKMTLKKELYKLEDFKNSVNTVILPLMNEKNITFTFNFTCGIENVFVDKLRFNQIFFNLLSNAAKYTPNGGAVEFSTSQISNNGNTVVIKYVVRDNGIGMSKEFMSHMFLPFDRDDNASNEQGTGLGLAIVKSVVTLMDGSIDVKSELNHGSEFIVILPLEIAAAQDNNIDDNSKTISKQLKGKHILLAEDNRINTLVAVRLLESEGMTVSTAQNGKIALELFEQSAVGSFDAILMDIRMPEMNGWDSAKAIRQLSRDDAKTVPIIAMTANAYEEDRQKSMDMGMNAHIAKPIDPVVMFGELYKYICVKDSDENE